jgi:para-aminobenzoate synthetase component 1
MDSLQLPYIANSLYWYQKIRALPWPIMLHSADGLGVDIISAAPDSTLVTRGAETLITRPGEIRRSGDDPFELLNQELAGRDTAGTLPQADGAVFAGGAMGYFGYDLCRRIEKLPATPENDISLPDMAVGIYYWSLETNHHHRTTLVRFHPNCNPSLRARLIRCLQPGEGVPPVQTHGQSFRLLSDMASNFNRASYGQAFDAIKAYIHSGDCYQVNLAQRFSGTFSGDPWELYTRLSRQMSAPFSAYMEGEGWAVLSFSPERFLSVRDNAVFAQPIKGTRPRGTDPTQDQRLALELLRSDKDRAENLMIVDLLRNDLGRSCKPGSIRVPALFRLEKFKNVQHLVSDVCGELEPGKTHSDLLRGCFPGGSITGAPKIRAMEIISEMEPHRRSVYCGSIGYLGFDGAMDTNIAIRTLVCDHNQVHCWAGGGIVADSDCQLEYEETFHKVDILLQALSDQAHTLVKPG